MSRSGATCSSTWRRRGHTGSRPTLDEARLTAEIALLKGEFPKTRELYREVCALLFFRFGQTPTANRLYQLVKRGSMGTPAAVLGEFWADLREKSRVRVERPDLPADLGEAAGELVVALWARATAQAQEVLDTQRAELEVQSIDAQAAVAAARTKLERSEAVLEQRATALRAAEVEIRALEKAQAEGTAARQALEREIAQLAAGVVDRDRALQQAREGFSKDLEKLRGTAERAEARLGAAEKRALMEIERERATGARLLKERDAAARRAEEADSRRHVETQALQAQLGDARQQIGTLEGSLDAVRRANVELADALRALREPARAAAAGKTGERAAPRRRAPAAGKASTGKRKPT